MKLCFFFQAEDGIRDVAVTGVQTCALPISPGCSPPASSINASILMTLAPQSASCRTQVGPARTRVRSSTLKRDRACEARGKAIQTTPHRTADKSSLWVSSIINSIADRRRAVMGKQLSDLIAMQAAVAGL